MLQFFSCIREYGYPSKRTFNLETLLASGIAPLQRRGAQKLSHLAAAQEAERTEAGLHEVQESHPQVYRGGSVEEEDVPSIKVESDLSSVAGPTRNEKISNPEMLIVSKPYLSWSHCETCCNMTTR